MERIPQTPRPNHISLVEQTGITWHTHDDQTPYWREDVAYRFSMGEIERFEEAANTLQGMCIQAVDALVQMGDFSRFGIPEELWPLIRQSWDRDEVSIYGRFDFAYNGKDIKVLEYNADTPTSLIEASLAQWFWIHQTKPDKDQFNSLHERLVAAWTRAKGFLPMGPVTFLCMTSEEDWNTVAYMRECAEEAGITTTQYNIEEIYWDEDARAFRDPDHNIIGGAFKLYPWEFMWQDEGGEHLLLNTCTFLEPMWKMLLSNKAIMAVLWEMFPDCPYLLPTYQDGPHGMTDFVKKPILSREGSNVEIHRGATKEVSDFRECYGAEGHVYQGLADIPCLDGHYPIIGAWIVDGESAGMGIRESKGLVTNNGSSFVPHFIEG